MTAPAILLDRYPMPENCTLELHRRDHPTHPYIARVVDEDANAAFPVGMICFPDDDAARRWCAKEQAAAKRACDTTRITVTR